ncbi:Hydroxymethylglutaryl-CoA lyase YngG [bioreactor metagenome]|uniref:Hydroxymethylglutaryl-CoA lyase YngG n=1 Tax=bioreactor metagenome TaxID=1076179 RepID=A0A645DTP2_9ZZZZ
MNIELPKKLNIIDVTLRDGLQNEERYVPLDAKLYLANKLIDAGFRQIEVGSISHVKYVPQFRDVDELLLALPRREDVQYTVLALTPKAIERVVGLLDKGAQIDRVLTGQIATSEAYALKNMRRTHEELFAEAERNVKALHDAGIRNVAGNIGTVFGCPLQGKVPIERAYEFVDRMFSIGFDEIEHSDPDGIATPKAVYDYFSVVMGKYPDPARHSFHTHDVRGFGIAGYYAAMLAGVTTFDCSVGCIGGQVANFLDGVPVPGTGSYYFDARRTGLVSTEDFVTMVNDMGLETGIDQGEVYQIARDLEKILGHQLTSFSSFVLPVFQG